MRTLIVLLLLTAASIAGVTVSNTGQTLVGGTYQGISTIGTTTHSGTDTYVGLSAIVIGGTQLNPTALTGSATYSINSGTAANLTGTITPDQVTGLGTLLATGTQALTLAQSDSNALVSASSAIVSQIPTNNNQLTNGAGYATTSALTSASSAIVGQIPTNNNQLANGSGYITNTVTGSISVSGTTTSGVVVVAGTNIQTALASASSAIVSQIPTNNNQLTNGAGYQTVTGTTAYSGTAGLAQGLTASGSTAAANAAPVQSVNRKTGTVMVTGTDPAEADILAIPNLVGWWEADSLALSDSANITSVPDKSGNGNALSQANSSLQPKYSISGLNGRPTMIFSNSVLTTATTFFDSSWNHALSVFVVCTKSTNNGTRVLISNDVQWYADAYDGNGSGFSAVAYNNGSRYGCAQPDLINEPTLFGYTYDGTVHTVRFNGKRGIYGTNTANLALTGALGVGDFPSTGFSWDGNISAVIIFKRGLTLPEVHTVESYLSNKYLWMRRQVSFIGDSLTRGQGSTTRRGLLAFVSPLMGGPKQWHMDSPAHDGYWARDIDTDIADSMRYSTRGNVDNVSVVWAGANDVVNSQVSGTTYAHIVNICNTLRNMGQKVVVSTLLPITDNAGCETNRQSINASIRANWSTFADAISDVGADPTIGAAGAQDNTTYYNADKTHILDTGYAIKAPLDAAGIKYALGMPVSGTAVLTSGSVKISDPNITAAQNIVVTSGTGISTHVNASLVSGTAIIMSGTSTDAGTVFYTIFPRP